MPLTLNVASLASRVVRGQITPGGIRRFATDAISDHYDPATNVLQKVWNGAVRFAGSLISSVWKLLAPIISFSFTALWGLVVASISFIWNFNWNASDAELDQSISSSFDSLGSALGGTLGNALGWLACGALPGIAIFAFNEPMGLYVLEQVGEEALEEIAGNIANLVRQTFTALTKAGVTYLYKNIRNLWREPDSKLRARLISEGHMTSEQVNKVISERNQPWSFASATENAINAIPNTFLKNFAEEFFEEFTESCVEAGYVVAGSVDSYLAQQQMANNNFHGSEEIVEILLNRETSTSSASPAASPGSP